MANVDLLKRALQTAEQTANNFQLDQIAFLVGGFPADHWVRRTADAEEFPRIKALLLEMTPGTETSALLRISSYMDREDVVGECADRIRRAVRG
jgi:hypothetical protein